MNRGIIHLSLNCIKDLLFLEKDHSCFCSFCVSNQKRLSRKRPSRWSKSKSLQCFWEEWGIGGQLLLSKPWPLPIRPEELIRHETGQARVRNEGHWVTRQTASVLYFIQPTVFWSTHGHFWWLQHLLQKTIFQTAALLAFKGLTSATHTHGRFIGHFVSSSPPSLTTI